MNPPVGHACRLVDLTIRESKVFWEPSARWLCRQRASRAAGALRGPPAGKSSSHVGWPNGFQKCSGAWKTFARWPPRRRRRFAAPKRCMFPDSGPGPGCALAFALLAKSALANCTPGKVHSWQSALLAELHSCEENIIFLRRRKISFSSPEKSIIFLVLS